MQSTLQERFIMQSTLQERFKMQSTLQERFIMQSTLQERFIMQSTLQERFIMQSTLQERFIMQSTLQECFIMQSTLQERFIMQSTLQERFIMQSTLQERFIMKSTLQERFIMQSTLQERFIMQSREQKEVYMKQSLPYHWCIYTCVLSSKKFVFSLKLVFIFIFYITKCPELDADFKAAWKVPRAVFCCCLNNVCNIFLHCVRQLRSDCSLNLRLFCSGVSYHFVICCSAWWIKRQLLLWFISVDVTVNTIVFRELLCTTNRVIEQHEHATMTCVWMFYVQFFRSLFVAPVVMKSRMLLL